MNRIDNFLHKMNPTLKELISGIFLWGLVLAGLLVWGAESPAAFAASLTAGVLAAAGMAIHMCCYIEDSLELTQEDASKHMKKGTLLRILAAMGMFVLVWLLHGSVVGVFLGLLTLKLGAYIQPVIHKIIVKWKERR